MKIHEYVITVVMIPFFALGWLYGMIRAFWVAGMETAEEKLSNR